MRRGRPPPEDRESGTRLGGACRPSEERTVGLPAVARYYQAVEQYTKVSDSMASQLEFAIKFAQGDAALHGRATGRGRGVGYGEGRSAWRSRAPSQVPFGGGMRRSNFPTTHRD